MEGRVPGRLDCGAAPMSATDSHRRVAPNYLDRVVMAMTYDGNRIKQAWLMGYASYAYTASFIGQTDPSVGEPVFTRWDAIKGGVECAWDSLWRKQ